MGNFTTQIGELICRLPLGFSQCFSSDGKFALGLWTIAGLLGLGVLAFLSWSPRR
jgi:hypothetical protein